MVRGLKLLKWKAILEHQHKTTLALYIFKNPFSRQWFSYICIFCCVFFQNNIFLVVKLCLALHNPMNCSPSGSSVHRISQARILEWVAISSSRDLPNPRVELMSPVSLPLAGRFFMEPPGMTLITYCWETQMKFLANLDNILLRNSNEIFSQSNIYLISLYGAFLLPITKKLCVLPWKKYTFIPIYILWTWLTSHQPLYNNIINRIHSRFEVALYYS